MLLTVVTSPWSADHVEIWNTRTLQKRQTLLVEAEEHPILPPPNKAGISSAEFSPSGLHIVTGSQCGTVNVWDLLEEDTLHCIGAKHTLHGHHSWVKSVKFSTDGSHFVTCCEYAARTWNTATGKIHSILESGTDLMRSAEFFPKRLSVLTAGATAKIWNLEDEK